MQLQDENAGVEQALQMFCYHNVLVNILVTMKKYLAKATQRKKGLFLAHSLRAQSNVVSRTVMIVGV